MNIGAPLSGGMHPSQKEASVSRFLRIHPSQTEATVSRFLREKKGRYFLRKIDLEKERKLLDREITFFHFKKAKKKAFQCLNVAKETGDSFFFFYFLSQRYILREDFDTAMKYLDLCLKIRENDGCTYNDKALCLAELGKYRQALVYFDEGIKRSRDCVTLYHNKGWLLHSLGRLKEALLYFRKALEIEPKRAESLYSLADTYFRLGDRIKTRKYFQEALYELRGRCSFMYRKTQQRLKELV